MLAGIGEADGRGLRAGQRDRHRLVEHGVPGQDLDEVGLRAVVDRHLVTVGEPDREVLGRHRQQAEVEADPGVGAAVERQLGDVFGHGERVGIGDQPARELEVREADVDARADREAVGQLDRDRGVDRPRVDLALEADVAAGERVGVVPLRAVGERPAHAQADHQLVAHLLRVVDRRQQTQAVARALERAHGRVGARAGEVGGAPDERAADVELLALQEADAGGVVEDRGRVRGLRHVGPREAHRPRALALDREARSLDGSGNGQERQRQKRPQRATSDGQSHRTSSSCSEDPNDAGDIRNEKATARTSGGALPPRPPNPPWRCMSIAATGYGIGGADHRNRSGPASSGHETGHLVQAVNQPGRG